ncbi:MAG: hypothetical protein IKZ64_01235, partial [Alphaproteobacteria bacterium]|nr:hypothetical protein [Alphaproteobacteria bacterium]
MRYILAVLVACVSSASFGAQISKEKCIADENMVARSSGQRGDLNAQLPVFHAVELMHRCGHLR